VAQVRRRRTLRAALVCFPCGSFTRSLRTQSAYTLARLALHALLDRLAARTPLFSMLHSCGQPVTDVPPPCGASLDSLRAEASTGGARAGPVDLTYLPTLGTHLTSDPADALLPDLYAVSAPHA